MGPWWLPKWSWCMWEDLGTERSVTQEHRLRAQRVKGEQDEMRLKRGGDRLCRAAKSVRWQGEFLAVGRRGGGR